MLFKCLLSKRVRAIDSIRYSSNACKFIIKNNINTSNTNIL